MLGVNDLKPEMTRSVSLLNVVNIAFTLDCLYKTKPCTSL